MAISTLIILLLLPVLSWILCRVVLIYTQKKAIFDIPNERSSHIAAKPRGGGLAVVIIFLLFVLVMYISKVIPLKLFLAIFGGGGLIACVGWSDDKKKGISILPRILLQLVAAIWAIYWLQGLPLLRIGDIRIQLGIFGYLVSVIGIVWVTNLYNFMDGIDGIAASEAVSIGVFAGCLLILAGAEGLAIICFALAFSSFGFLVWNWPPSKIFMGDVGSSFFGFIFAILAINSENNNGLPLLIWVVLLGVFFVDTTFTLIRRVYQRERWYEGHRTHAYQCAVQMGFTHKQVTMFVIYLNSVLALFAIIMWYFPILTIPMFLVVLVILLSIQVIVYTKFLSHRAVQELYAATKEISIKEEN